MPLELVKENITLDKQAGKQTSQILLEGDIIVPDNKPDIERVLRVSGEPRLLEQKVNKDRINFSGELVIYVLYQGKKSSKPLYGIEARLPIEDLIHMEGIDEDTQVQLSLTLDHLEERLINDRKLGIKAVLGVLADAKKVDEFEVVQEITMPKQMQVLTDILQMDQQVAKQTELFTIKEELPLPTGKPDVDQIILSDVQITDQDVRAMDGRVLVRGNLKASVLYIASGGENLMELVTFTLPFSGYIDAKEVKNGMEPRVRLTVEEKEIRPLPDENGEDRLMDISVTLRGDMEVVDQKEVPILTDAYMPGKDVQVEKTPIEYTKTKGNTKNQMILKEVVTLTETETPMMQVEKAWATVSVDEVEAKKDMLQVEGVVTLEVMYIGEDDDAPVAVVTRSIPFEQNIEVKGITEEDIADVEANVEDVSFQLLSDKEGEARITLGFDALVTEEKEAEVISSILFDEEGKGTMVPIASAVLYVVQKGDTLWNIAKTYDTTVEDILLLNDIENPDLIYPGEKLLILKKVVE